MSCCILIECCLFDASMHGVDPRINTVSITEIQNNVFFASSSAFIIGILHWNHSNGSVIGKYIAFSGRRRRWRSIVCAPLRQNKHTWSRCSYARERNAHIEWTAISHTMGTSIICVAGIIIIASFVNGIYMCARHWTRWIPYNPMNGWLHSFRRFVLCLANVSCLST